MKNVLILLSFLLTFNSCISDEQPSNGKNLQPGDCLPTFMIMLNNNSTVSTSDLQNKISLIVFFNTQCIDCQKELPIIQKINTQYSNHSDIRIVCISREEEEASITAYWEKNNFTFPFSAQKDRRIYNLFANKGIPHIFVVNKKGIIEAVYSDDPIATEEDLSKWINFLLTQ